MIKSGAPRQPLSSNFGVAAALQYISYYHPADFIAHLARAYEREQGPAAKDAIAQILTNSRMWLTD